MSNRIEIISPPDELSSSTAARDQDVLTSKYKKLKENCEIKIQAIEAAERSGLRGSIGPSKTELEYCICRCVMVEKLLELAEAMKPYSGSSRVLVLGADARDVGSAIRDALITPTPSVISRMISRLEFFDGSPLLEWEDRARLEFFDGSPLLEWEDRV